MLEGLPSLPEEMLEIYDRPPLVLAICQIRFAPVLSVAQPGFVASFQESIALEYPITNQSSTIELQLRSQGGFPHLQQKEEHPQHWEFLDTSDNWKVSLAQDSVAMETRNYGRRKLFLERLQGVLDSVVTHVRPTIMTRIGLRYINEIRPGSEVNWAAVISPDFLGPLGTQELSNDIKRCLQEIILRYPDGEGVNVRHGLLPGGTTVVPRKTEPAPQGPFYLLDFDAYREFAYPSVAKMDSGLVVDLVSRFSERLYSLFCRVVRDDYRSTLGGRPRWQS